MSLGNYRDQIKDLIEKRDGETIYNGSMDHAAIIMENLFKNAKREILILSGKLNVHVYGRDEVVEQAARFLNDPSRKLRILLEDVGENQLEKYRKRNPFFEKILDGKRPNVEVLRMPENTHDRYKFHFAVMDDDSYRYESDKKEPAAIAAFGDVEGTSRLRGIFEKMLNDAQRLNLAA